MCQSRPQGVSILITRIIRTSVRAWRLPGTRPSRTAFLGIYSETRSRWSAPDGRVPLTALTVSGLCSLRRLESVLVISRFAGHQTLRVYAETAAIPRAISESGLTETTSPSRRCQLSAAGSSFRVWGVRVEERYARRTPTAYSRTATLVLIRRIASEARI